MAQLSVETLRRLSHLGLPEVVKKKLTGTANQVLISDCTRGCIRPLSIAETKQLNVLAEYGGFEIYHAVQYEDAGCIKTAFLITSPFVDEWRLEYVSVSKGHMCFAFVFKNSSLEPTKEMLTVAARDGYLQVLPNSTVQKTAIFV